jgi:hypothetical protein
MNRRQLKCAAVCAEYLKLSCTFEYFRYLGYLPTSSLSDEYPETELTRPAWSPRYITSTQTQQITPPTKFFLLLSWAVI